MKRILSKVIIFTLLLSNMVYAGGWSFNNSSNWAKEELENAMINGIADVEYDDYNRDITRLEFADLVMNLFYQVSGNLPVAANYSTFTDTTNTNVLMAYNVGIINGKGNGIFAPNDAITRQEMAVMMLRTVKMLGVDYNSGDGILTISDNSDVASWATAGVDFAFENDFMKGDGFNFKPLDPTPIEQAVIIMNRAFEKYDEEMEEPEANDYTQGYKIDLTTSGDLYIKYNNTGNKVLIAQTIVKADYSKNDKSKLYYLTKSMGYIKKTDLDDGSITFLSGVYYAKDFVVVEGGKYDGYIIYKEVTNGTTTYKVLDDDETYVGDVDSLRDPNYQIGEMYTSIYEEENKFTIEVTDSVTHPDTVNNFDEDDFYFYSNARHYDFIDDGVGYLRMYPSAYDNNAYCGPMARLGSSNFMIAHNGYGALYEVDITFNNNSGNAGIVFNVTKAGNGNDNYVGYYVGISPDKDCVQIGKAAGNWTNLKEVSLGYDISEGDTVTLYVQKNGSKISVFLDGKMYIDISDSTYSSDGGFGIRTWKSDASYSNYTVKPLPY